MLRRLVAIMAALGAGFGARAVASPRCATRAVDHVALAAAYARAKANLAEKLVAKGKGNASKIISLQIPLEGWTFFRVLTPRPKPTPFHASYQESIVILRENGTIVDAPPGAELSAIFRRLKLVHNPCALEIGELARVISCFIVGRESGVVGEEDAADYRKRLRTPRVHAPRVASDGRGGLEIAFWSLVPPCPGRCPMQFERIVVRVSARYDVQLSPPKKEVAIFR
jgi:hypothetical protein